MISLWNKSSTFTGDGGGGLSSENPFRYELTVRATVNTRSSSDPWWFRAPPAAEEGTKTDTAATVLTRGPRVLTSKHLRYGPKDSSMLRLVEPDEERPRTVEGLCFPVGSRLERSHPCFGIFLFCRGLIFHY